VGLPRIAQQEIDYDIGRQSLDFRSMRHQIVPIPNDTPHRFWQIWLGIPSMEHSQLVPPLDQIADYEWSDKTSSADDQDLQCIP
jgi:hypothetical protein